MSANLPMTEAWRSVAADPRYQVSRAGLVRGPRGRVLSPDVVTGGYLRVRIAGRHHLVHLVVAEAFLGPKPTGHQVNHIDGDTANNAVSNLEYVTPSQNVRHSLDVLGVKRAAGERNARSRLTAAEVATMRAEYAAGVSAAEVGRRHGIDCGHAWRIVTRRAWRHVA